MCPPRGLWQPRELWALTDSSLVHGHWTGRKCLRNRQLRELVPGPSPTLTFPVHWEHIPREQNKLADRLAGQASQAALRGFATPVLPTTPPGGRIHTLAYTFLPEAPVFCKMALLPTNQAWWGKRETEYVQSATLLMGATYTPRGSLQQGRRYVLGTGGAALGRKARLLLFGLTHCEWDLRAAHSTLLGQALLWDTPGHALGTLLSDPDRYRALIATAAAMRPGQLTVAHAKVKEGQPLVKFLARLLIMASDTQARYVVEGQRLRWTQELQALAADIRAGREISLAILWQAGYQGRPTTDTTPKNRLYFALESLEAALMTEWLRRLPLNCPSILWVGDAFWIHRSVSQNEVAIAFQHACVALRVEAMRATPTDLTVERDLVPWTPPWVLQHTELTHPVYPHRGRAGVPKGVRLAPRMWVPDKWDSPASEAWLELFQAPPL